MCLKLNFLIVFIVLLGSCQLPMPTEEQKLLKEELFLMEDTANVQMIAGDSTGTWHFCRSDSANLYGPGLSYFVPDSNTHKSLLVLIEAKVRFSHLGDVGTISTGLSKDGKTLFWKSLKLDAKILKENTWVAIRDSFLIPAEVNTEGNAELKTFPFWTGTSFPKSYLDIDSLRVKVSSFKIYKN